MGIITATVCPGSIIVNITAHLDLAVTPGQAEVTDADQKSSPYPTNLNAVLESAAAASVCRALRCLQINIFDSASSGCLDSQ